jgi:hypothetical protein
LLRLAVLTLGGCPITVPGCLGWPVRLVEEYAPVRF